VYRAAAPTANSKSITHTITDAHTRSLIFVHFLLVLYVHCLAPENSDKYFDDCRVSLTWVSLAKPSRLVLPRRSGSSVGKRTSSRLRDPETAAKHKAFLHKVNVATNGSMDTYLKASVKGGNEWSSETGVLSPEDEAMEGNTTTAAPATAGLKRKLIITGLPGSAGQQGGANKRRRSNRNSSSGTDGQNDCYCWICHKEGEVICCDACPRVFHLKCIQLELAPTEDWVCPECVLIEAVENMDTRSRSMRLLTVDQLCTLLKHALTRMRSVSGVEPFSKPVDPLQFPAYRDYVSCPMDLSTMEKMSRGSSMGQLKPFLQT